jgi:hypothetical protein
MTKKKVKLTADVSSPDYVRLIPDGNPDQDREKWYPVTNRAFGAIREAMLQLAEGGSLGSTLILSAKSVALVRKQSGVKLDQKTVQVVMARVLKLRRQEQSPAMRFTQHMITRLEPVPAVEMFGAIWNDDGEPVFIGAPTCEALAVEWKRITGLDLKPPNHVHLVEYREQLQLVKKEAGQ